MTTAPRDAIPLTFAEAIRSLPRAFRPEQAADGGARVHVAATGPEPGNWMITVREGKCTVEKGAIPGVRPVIHVPSDVWLLIARRELAPEEAMSQGLLYFDGEPEVFHKLRSWFV